MKIVSWNMNYWRNTERKFDNVIEWKRNCIEYLKNEKNVDFYLLQEINPFKLFEKMPNQYFFSMPDYNILYHELKSELLFDGRSDNFWGNAILFNKKYSVEKNNIDIKKKYYYGRNAIMCYDFKLPNRKTFTIINVYNKINHAYNSKYTMWEYFKKDADIQNIIKRNNTILAGDLNTFAKKDNKNLEILEELKPLINCAKEQYKRTYYDGAKNGYGVDDFCFASKDIVDKINVTIPEDKFDDKQDKDHRWNGLSDHCPIIVDFDLKPI
jgi:endonuclease/exonuclease/phosphatase family metal-dependent hydrolase